MPINEVSRHFRAKLSLCVLIGFLAQVSLHTAAFAQQTGTARVTQQQLAEFASTVERAVENNDSSLFQSLIDWNTIKTNVSAGIDLHPTLHQKFWARAESEVASAWISEQHFGSLRGEFRFRRLIQRNGELQAIFRRIHSGGEGNFLILSVSPSASGGLAIVDFEKPTVGVSFVRDLRFSCSLMSHSLGNEVGAAPTPTQFKFIRRNGEFRRLEQLVIAGDGTSALTVYANLSPEFQNDMRAKSFRLQAAILLRDPKGQQYRDAVNDLLSATNDTLTRSFVLMTYYTGTGNSEAAAKELASVKTFVGQDGWLDTEFALGCLEYGDLDTGRIYAENAVKTEPDLSAAHMALMAVAAAQGDFVAAARSLQRMDAIKPLRSEKHLESKPELKQFVVSQPYLQWKEIRFKEKLEQERRVAREAKAFFESLESK